MTSKPLQGFTVIDCSAVYAGPICARLLADAGADVIKIESPGAGDQTRGPTGSSRVFAHFNAGKRSIALDLKQPRGQAVARELMARADIFIENFRPGVMQRFGLDYASVAEDQPHLVYCSISGFGQQGPFAQHGAYAPIAHASSGYDKAHMAGQADPDGEPQRSGIMIADMLTGAYAFGAVQTALLGRSQTGKGDHIDISMQESMMMMIPAQIQAAQVESPPRAGGFRPIRVKDGHVMVCVVSERNFQCLCRAINRPDMLGDDRFARGNRFRNMDALVVAMEQWSKDLSAAECERLLNEGEVPCSAYNSAADLFAHPQLGVRDAFREFSDADGTFLIQNTPFHLARGDVSITPTCPALGEHSVSVLREVLDMPEAEIRLLQESGVIS